MIRGRVQGVGFRPSVYRLAGHFSLSGFVKNTGEGVLIEVEGKESAITEFISTLQSEKPRQAIIESLESGEIASGSPRSGNVFFIAPSKRSGDLSAGMPPDLAICDQCRRELFDPGNRRRQYPFINCVDCGPRFTIMEKLPYDRRRTSMKAFRMCPDCRSEFENPADRRFDAQPNACAVCGPKVRLIDRSFTIVNGDPIERAVGLLKKGKILAVKGVGGYHICCDALNVKAATLLRKRKNRPHKPLAVMFRSIKQIGEYCFLGSEETAELESFAAPIVVLRRRKNTEVLREISPDTGDIGAFLPYSPLHSLLLDRISPLVMTSGNSRDEPMAIDESALKRILGQGKIADFALIHNRPIVRRCDDSVVKFSAGRRIILRRSRGFVPAPIRLPLEGPPVLACGAEMKNTICVTRDAQAFLSPHIGDIDELGGYEFFRENVNDFMRLLDIRPKVVACDMHPDYLSTRFALALRGVRIEKVQHHHAHIASCLAEHSLREKIIGVALDGTGFGPDNTIWGGEFMIADLKSFVRVGHFKQYPMPGGARAILEPERMALSYLAADIADDSESFVARRLPSIPLHERRILLDMIKQEKHSPLTSSAGRLFDAVAVLLGFAGQVSYEGRPAVWLQALADRKTKKKYDYEIREQTGMLLLSFAETIRGIVGDLKKDAGVGVIAGIFHNTVAAALARMCVLLRKKHGLNRVALSGGVFQNDLLLAGLISCLKNDGFKVYINEQAPPNDGGIALGQAAVALARSM